MQKVLKEAEENVQKEISKANEKASEINAKKETELPTIQIEGNIKLEVLKADNAILLKEK